MLSRVEHEKKFYNLEARGSEARTHLTQFIYQIIFIIFIQRFIFWVLKDSSL